MPDCNHQCLAFSGFPEIQYIDVDTHTHIYMCVCVCIYIYIYRLTYASKTPSLCQNQTYAQKTALCQNSRKAHQIIYLLFQFHPFANTNYKKNKHMERQMKKRMKLPVYSYLCIDNTTLSHSTQGYRNANESPSKYAKNQYTCCYKSKVSAALQMSNI